MGSLVEIQKTLKANKGQYNSFGKYAYRSCEDILEAVKPLLGTSSLVLSDDVVEVGGRVYVRATATFIDGNTTRMVNAFAREPESQKGMNEAQITGSASSYARKYALNGLFLIDDTKDADTMDNTKVTAKKLPELVPNTPAWTNVIKGLKGKFTMDQVESKYSVSDVTKKKLNEEVQNKK